MMQCSDPATDLEWDKDKPLRNRPMDRHTRVCTDVGAVLDMDMVTWVLPVVEVVSGLLPLTTTIIITIMVERWDMLDLLRLHRLSLHLHLLLCQRSRHHLDQPHRLIGDLPSRPRRLSCSDRLRERLSPLLGRRPVRELSFVELSFVIKLAS